MRDVQRAAIDHADDLPLAVQPLTPDALRRGDAGLVRPRRAAVVVERFGHFFDQLDVA